MALNLENLARFIAKREVAFIASVAEDGTPLMKAMLPPRRCEGMRVLYFSTNTSSLRVAQYRANPKASVYFFHKGPVHYEGVLLTGTMAVLKDEASKRLIWRTGDTLYYRKGVTDPDYCVLRFTATAGRHYRDLRTEAFEL